MSGPKRADVEAQLNVARDAQRRCGAIISKARNAAIDALLKDTTAILRENTAGERELNAAQQSITAEMTRIAAAGMASAVAAAQSAQTVAAQAQQALQQAQDSVRAAKQQQTSADSIFAQANKAYEEAAAALSAAGQHYLQGPMAQARRAKEQFNRANAEIEAAARTRKQAEGQAGEALRAARNAASALAGARGQIASATSEAQALLRAEADARRISEEKQRLAMLSFGQAHAAIATVASLPHEKFSPGELAKEQQTLARIKAVLDKGEYDAANAQAAQLCRQARLLEEQVTRARQEWEGRKNAADASLRELEVAIAGADPALIGAWSSQADALDTARQVADALGRQISAERFDGVPSDAVQAHEALMAALLSAAEHQRDHEKRLAIGEAVMDVMEELGFDVSYDAGSRDAPLRISGQTPEVSGRGDFDIAIPLTGEVDFKLNTPEGDTTCVATIEALQDKLRDRGVAWNTTNWGHAEGHADTEQTKTRQREKIRLKQTTERSVLRP